MKDSMPQTLIIDHSNFLLVRSFSKENARRFARQLGKNLFYLEAFEERMIDGVKNGITYVCEPKRAKY